VNVQQQADPLIGHLVDGRYRIRGRVARGGMATVYVATDLRLERRVALKIMHGHLSDDSVFQSRFIQEARAAARLADPNVVNVFDQGQDGEIAYLVMEYLPGITLRELLRDQRRLNLSQTITIMDAVLSGLLAAHNAGIVHRDVKPENVLLAEDGRIKIGDFGLARASSANTATGQQLLGTIAYLAPELVTRGTADARSDIYALGIMLYEMLTGEQPYRGEQPMQIAFQHATDSVPRPSIKNAVVPDSLDELVLWATERSPDDRPRDAGVMLDRLREIERELGIHPEVTATVTAQTHQFGEPLIDSTRVLGPLAKTSDTTAATSRVEPVDRSNASILRSRAAVRERRGGATLAFVLVLTLVAGLLGWWFGSGPGSLVAVPQVSGLSYTAAAQALTAQGFVPSEASEHSLTVEAGRVIRTNPIEGERIDRESRVTVYVSLGPESVTLPALRDLPLDDVVKLLDQNFIEIVGTPLEVFASLAKGQVLNAAITERGSNEAINCNVECTVLQGSQAELRVSLGPLPAVVGKPFAEAEQALEAVGLTVKREDAFSCDVALGSVIEILDRVPSGPWRPGDELTLVVSKGPELFQVPNVVGMTRDDAKRTLKDHGFESHGSGLWWNWWVNNNATEVTSQNPSAGSMFPKGTVIVITGTP
jgi:serine/threonine protein kinase/beta-lactam-binding protein with PASTA domain